MTFKTAFKHLYADFLEEYGYKYCNKLNFFVKVLNKELVFVIGYRGVSAEHKGDKAFTIVAGIVSIYYFSLEEKWLIVNAGDLFYYSRDPEHFSLNYNENNMEEIIRNSFSDVKRNIIPVFDKVIDLNSYIEYKKRFNIDEIRYCDRFYRDSLVLIESDNHDSFMNFIKERVNTYKKEIDEGKYPKECTIEYFEKLLYEGIIESIPKARDRVYADPDLLQQAHEEAERRKENNLRFLESCKIPL